MVSDGLKRYRQSVWEAKRTAILHAARDIVLSGRLAVVKMSDVALEAGVSTATLYKHFASREVLFEQVIETACLDLERALSIIDMPGSPREILRQFLSTYAEQHSQGDAILLCRLASDEALMGQGRMNGIGNRISKAGYNEFERLVEGLVACGALKAHDARRGARQLLGMIREELIWPALLNAGFEPPADTNEIIDDAIETYLARYGAREPTKTGHRQNAKPVEIAGKQ